MCYFGLINQLNQPIGLALGDYNYCTIRTISWIPLITRANSWTQFIFGSILTFNLLEYNHTIFGTWQTFLVRENKTYSWFTIHI